MMNGVSLVHGGGKLSPATVTTVAPSSLLLIASNGGK